MGECGGLCLLVKRTLGGRGEEEGGDETRWMEENSGPRERGGVRLVAEKRGDTDDCFDWGDGDCLCGDKDCF